MTAPLFDKYKEPALVENLELSNRVHNCMMSTGYHYVRDLELATDADLVGLRGFGKRSLDEVRKATKDFRAKQSLVSFDTKSSRAAGSALMASGVNMIPTEMLIGELSARLVAWSRKQEGS